MIGKEMIWDLNKIQKPSKVSTRKKNSYQFFLLDTIEIAQLEEVILQNVGCRPTVYKTGSRANLKAENGPDLRLVVHRVPHHLRNKIVWFHVLLFFLFTYNSYLLNLHSWHFIAWSFFGEKMNEWLALFSLFSKQNLLTICKYIYKPGQSVYFFLFAFELKDRICILFFCHGQSTTLFFLDGEVLYHS